jgi:hypothetical protein
MQHASSECNKIASLGLKTKPFRITAQSWFVTRHGPTHFTNMLSSARCHAFMPGIYLGVQPARQHLRAI